MSPTTPLLDSPDLQKLELIEKDDHVSSYKVCHPANGCLYNLTILHSSPKDGHACRSIGHHEFEILRALDHPNILKFYEVFSRYDGMQVLSEFFASKSLLGSHIKDESRLSNLTRQVLSALSYLHKRDLAHGGIRPSRFFMDSINGCAKIVYFGPILPANVIPERIRSLDRFSGDVWSLCLSILELFVGSSPLDMNNPCFKQTPEAPSTASAEFKDFISCCLQNDSAKIWTADQLLHHPFIVQNTKSSNNLQGQSLREKTEVQQPFLMSSTSNSSSWRPRSEEIRVSESAMQLSPPPVYGSNSNENEAEASSVGKSEDGRNVKGKQQILGLERCMSDRSLLVQRCAKRKRLKVEANARDMSKKLIVVKRNNSSSNQEETISDYSSTESEEHDFMQEKGMHFMGRAEKFKMAIQGAEFESESLPEYAKSCMLHCSLFPLDYEFDKDTLVQLWIAEELIDSKVTPRMEDDGRVCFDILANKEFIVPSSYDILHGQQKYKVNESKASWWHTKGGLSRGGYQRIQDKINDISERSLHLSLDMQEIDESIFEVLKNNKHLRTVLLVREYGSSVKQIPRSLFLFLHNLCTLDLSWTHISELPCTVGCLESLRYLNLSYTPIKLLPDSIDSLHSLQTLKLRNCFALRALPEGMSNLINLRHLDLDIVRQLSSMPKGMGNLINIHTLKAFMVGKGDGQGIGELKNLNYITGSLCISRLENVVKLEEAVKAGLSTKQHLKKLGLRWSDAAGDEILPQEEVLECLQPHYGLNELQIQFYNGSMFPNWIGNPSFNSIVSITIYKCKECQVLPSLGNLPALKFLNIIGLDSVEALNGLFAGSHGTQGHTDYPKLEKLTLDNMLNLQELSGAENGDFPCLIHVSIRYCPKLFDLSLLSHLKVIKNLEISHCKVLLSLPEAGFPTSIESLQIKGCPNITQRYQKNVGQGWCEIARIPRIWIDNEEISSM